MRRQISCQTLGQEVVRHRDLSRRCSANLGRRLKERAVMVVGYFVWSLCIHAQSISLERPSKTAIISRRHKSTILGVRMAKGGALSMAFQPMPREAGGFPISARRCKAHRAHPRYL